MKRKSLNLLCVLVVGAMFVAAFAPIGLVGAGPGQQFNMWGDGAEWGTDQGGAGAIPAGSEITGWIDGVSYGINTTTAANPQFVDLYVDADVWGVPINNSEKEGGYDGDTIQYFIDYDPTDYYLQISDTTSTFLEGDYVNNALFFDTQTNWDSAIGNTYLRGLKINEIVFDPWDYVYIYDPGGELDEAALEDAGKGYYLQVDNSTAHTVNGDIFDFNLYPDDVVAFGDPNYYYINVSKHPTMDLTADDELKLVWKNPGGGDNIANGTHVIVDRVEWGNYINYFSGPDPLVRDHDNTNLSNIAGTPIAGQSFRLSTNGSDSDNPATDFQVLPATPWPEVPPDLGIPGAPTNLRVHKGGGSWGATSDDLVLTWDAPSWNYTKLKKNIVYYDMDLSDGFQYTLYEMYDTTYPGAGMEDSAVLDGYLFDSFEYAFVVHTSGNNVGSYENMTNSNVGYKFNQVLDAPSGDRLVWISIPYFSDYDMLSDIAHETDPDAEFADGSIITSVNLWNFSLQQYQKRQWLGFWLDDYDIEPGDAIQIQLNPSAPVYTWKVVGAYDDTLQFKLLKNPSGMQFKMLSLPYHRTYQIAPDITAEFPTGSEIDIVAKYNYAIHNWQSWLYFDITGWIGDDFDIYPAPADVIMFQVTATPTPVYWQPQVMGL